MGAKFYYKDADAPTPNLPTSIGITAIIKYKDQYLFESRVDCDQWSLVGGGMEDDESLEDCAMREILEETGIKVKIEDLNLIKLYSCPSRIAEYPDGNVIRIVSVVFEIDLKTKPDTICSEESLELKWLKKDEIIDLDIVETHKHVVEELILGI
ncbi:MAG: Nucleoside triphosphatase NudI [Candidatus Izimaplasma bacterium HR2]|nr:MAG: Nucleoside triphosphatase NudI [Candidatus Izimaplasma bacterium HR2]